MDEKTTKQTAGYGITEDDLERIKGYLQKKPHVRTVDDLRPASER